MLCLVCIKFEKGGENMKKGFSDADEYFAAIEGDLRASQGTSPWLELFCGRAMGMQNYSTRNVASILLQFPAATDVAGASVYRERGAMVLPGAMPIWITAPKRASDGQKAAAGFRMVEVYDVSQTTTVSRKRKFLKEQEFLKKVYRLTKKAGFRAEYTNLTMGAWKVVDRIGNEDVIFLQAGLSPAISGQLLCQELIRIALVKEGRTDMSLVAYAMADVSSYCVAVGFGMQVPNLHPMDKLNACLGPGLLVNTDTSLKMAKRVCTAIKNI